MIDELIEIRKAFRDYFEGEHLLPEIVPPRGTIDYYNGWMINFILKNDDEGNPYLDFTAEHRMTNPRHHRIDHHGKITFLEMYHESYGYNPEIPGDMEKKQAEFFDHNRKVMDILIAKGLLESNL